MPAYITGLGCCLPNAPVGNDEIESVLGVVGGRPSRLKDVVLMRNGIQSRHYAIDRHTGEQTHSNAELTVAAIRQAMAADPNTAPVQLLSCGTSSPDQWIPNHAAMVQGLLRWPPCEIVSTAGVCCSGMTALKYAYLSILNGTTTRAVVSGSELASTALRASHFQSQIEARVDENPFLAFEHEFLRWMLSDGAGAMLLADQPRSGGTSLRIDWLDILSFAGELETCMYSGAVKQADGSLRGWRAETELAELLEQGYLNLSQDTRLLEKNIVPVAFRRSLLEVRERRAMHADRVDWLLPHLSSEVFRRPIAEMLAACDFAIPDERWFTNLSRKGNTGAASIFIMLEELLTSGRLERGQRIMCVVPESARFTFAYLHLTVV
jgi:3-oxoacyl-[acyl-carrier-protein] synthase-3